MPPDVYGMLNHRKDGTQVLREIMEQPEAILRTLEQSEKDLNRIARLVRNKNQLVFAACGSSKNAAQIGHHLFSELADKMSEVIIASEFAYFSDSLNKETLVLAVSQSGETPELLDAVAHAKQKGATIVSLVNTVGSSLDKMSDERLYLNCGPEYAAAATKSYTSQLALLSLLALAMAGQFEKGKKDLVNISYKVNLTLAENYHDLSMLANSFKDRKRFFLLGRGLNSAMASEGALKLKEIAGIHAEGLPAGELKHGSLALIEKGTVVIVICPNDHTFIETINNAAETKARGAYVVGISDKQDDLFDQWIKIPTSEHIYYPILYCVPVQLFACYLAVAQGKNPAFPPNLMELIRYDEKGRKSGRVG